MTDATLHEPGNLTAEKAAQDTRGEELPQLVASKHEGYHWTSEAPMFLYAVWYLAFLYIPVLFLPLFSFNDSIYVAFPAQGFHA